MALTIEEFKKAVEADKKKPKPKVADPWEDFGAEIDRHPIINPERRSR